MSTSPPPTAWNAWVDLAEPGLLTNKIIREYITAYSREKWPEVVKLTLLHGILCLQKTFRSKIPTVHELRRIVESGKYTLTLDSNVPTLKADIEGLQKQLNDIANELASPGRAPPVRYIPPDSTAKPSVQAKAIVDTENADPTVVLREYAAPVPTAAAAPPVVPPLPLRQLTTGAAQPSQQPGMLPVAAVPVLPGSPPPAGKPSPRRESKGEGIYPEWWGDGHLLREVRYEPQPKPARPPPRLAYSLPPSPGPPVTADDLVTSEYLDVPSSGYRQLAEAAPVQQAQQWDEAAGPASPQHPMPLPKTAAVRPATAGPTYVTPRPGPSAAPGISTRRVGTPAESRVRQQLEQQHLLAQQREAARQQRVAGAVHPRPVPAQYREAAPRDPERGYATEQPPTQIADSLLANPWTAQLMDSDVAGPSAATDILGGLPGPSHEAMPPLSGAAGEAARPAYPPASRGAVGQYRPEARQRAPSSRTRSAPQQAQREGRRRSQWVGDFGHLDSRRFPPAHLDAIEMDIGNIAEQEQEQSVQENHVLQAAPEAPDPSQVNWGTDYEAQEREEGETSGRWDFDAIVQR